MIIYNSGISGSGVRRMQTGTISSGTTASSIIGTMKLSLGQSETHYLNSYKVSGVMVKNAEYNKGNSSSVIYKIPLNGFSKTDKMSITIESLNSSSLSGSFTVSSEASHSSGYAFKYIIYNATSLDPDSGDITDAIKLCPYTASASINSITYGLSSPNELYISIPYNTIFKAGTNGYTNKTITNTKEWYDYYFYYKAFADIEFGTTYSYKVNTDKGSMWKSFTVDELGAATTSNGTVSSQFVITAKTTGTLKYTVIEYY